MEKGITEVGGAAEVDVSFPPSGCIVTPLFAAILACCMSYLLVRL
jgi:hypothetical protein